MQPNHFSGADPRRPVEESLESLESLETLKPAFSDFPEDFLKIS